MMKIVPMNASHIPALTELESVCFSTPWTAEGFAEELDNPLAHFAVAEDDGQVLGYIGVQEICGEGYVADFAVFPAYRGRGIGTALLRHALDGAKARGCAFLSLEVRTGNDGAIRLYEALGFEQVGLRRQFYKDPAEDARIYTKYFEETDV